MFEAIERECTNHASEHRLHTIVVLDEMHLMPDAMLANLHLLATFR